MNLNRSSDLVILLGAGASADANIPVSAQMINELESSFQEGSDQQKLYNHVKSAIFFSAGLHGSFNTEVPYNIEVLVNTLNELERNEHHPLFPFIAAWNSRFVSLAGPNFSYIANFRKSILERLKRWVVPDDPSKADYYKGLARLQKDLTYPLQIFSLNYDLCVERLSTGEFAVETGFAGFGPQFTWESRRFETDGTSGVPMPNVFLYKLHGSIDWKRDDATKKLYRVEQTVSVEIDRLELIFGREVKMEAADPYLYFAYRFRELTLSAKVITCLGYGFGDSHINKMLNQSLRNDPNQRLVVVQRCSSGEIIRRKGKILSMLDLDDRQLDQIIIEAGSAKDLLEKDDLAALLTSYIPADPDAPF